MTTDSFLDFGEGKPSGSVCRVLCMWNPEVLTTPDPTHEGAPVAGIAGRVYLMGTDFDRLLVGDGSLKVDLYNDAVAEPGKTPIPLEEWRIDRDTLKRLKRKDGFGWGYTIFLPWGTYKPEIQHVHLKVCYQPVSGSPIYEDSPSMVLHEPKQSAPVTRTFVPR